MNRAFYHFYILFQAVHDHIYNCIIITIRREVTMKNIYKLHLLVLVVLFTIPVQTIRAQNTADQDFRNKIIKQQKTINNYLKNYRVEPTTNNNSNELRPVLTNNLWLHYNQFNKWDSLQARWKYQLRTYYSYNTDSTKKEELGQLWDSTGNQWQHLNMYMHQYDTQKKRTETVVQYWDTTQWMNIYRYQYGFNAIGKKSQNMYQMWDGTQWQNQTREQYMYNNQNQLSEQIDQFWLGNTWMNTNRYQYTYNSNGDNTEEVYQEWDGNQWTNQERYQYTYTNSGKINQEIYQKWNSTQSKFNNQNRYTYSYDNQGNNTEYLEEKWDGANWQNQSRTQLSYNAQNQWTLWLTQAWNQNMITWTHQYRTQFTYNSDNDLSEILDQVYYSGNWENLSQQIYEYTSTRPDAVPTPVEKSHVTIPDAIILNQNFPNPFNPSTQIAYELTTPQNVRLSVYDITGRRIATLINSRQSAGSHIVSFNANNLSSGIYFYRLEAGDFMQTRKMILLK